MKLPEIILKHPTRGYAYVRQGFCWPAFFLGAAWAIVKRKWLLCGLLLVAELLLAVAQSTAISAHSIPSQLGIIAINLSFLFIRGHYGNRWLLATLMRQEYQRLPE